MATLTIMESRNTEILHFIPLIWQHYKKMLEWNIKQRDDCNLAHTETTSTFVVEFRLAGLQWNIYPRCLKMSKIQMHGNWNLPLDVWTWNTQNVYKTLHTPSAHGSPPCLFSTKPVLSLARPNFFTGAIIETRFQASLPAPPGCL